MERDPYLSGRRLAFWAAVTAAAVAVVSALALRSGLPGGGDLVERMAYVSGHRGVWIFGWALRMLLFILVLGVFVSLSRTLTPGFPVMRSLAVHLAAIGVAADLIASTVLASALPTLAERFAEASPGTLSLIVALEGSALALGGLLGIGLLSLAGALLCGAGWSTPPFPRPLAIFAAILWGSGVLASGATIAGGARGFDMLTLLFFPMLALWLAGIGGTHFRMPHDRV